MQRTPSVLAVRGLLQIGMLLMYAPLWQLDYLCDNHAIFLLDFAPRARSAIWLPNSLSYPLFTVAYDGYVQDGTYLAASRLVFMCETGVRNVGHVFLVLIVLFRTNVGFFAFTFHLRSHCGSNLLKPQPHGIDATSRHYIQAVVFFQSLLHQCYGYRGSSRVRFELLTTKTGVLWSSFEAAQQWS